MTKFLKTFVVIFSFIVAFGCSDEKKFFKAVQKGDLKEVKKILENGFDVQTKVKKSEDQEQAIHIASGNGNKEMVELFLQKGAGINTCDKYGKTPLFYAVIHLRPEMIRFLIEQKCDPNIKDIYQISPLHYAAENGLISETEALLSGQINMNTTNKDMRTPLHLAIVKNQKDIARLLIIKGADLRIQDEDGNSPLHLACREGDLTLIEFISKKGTVFNTENKYGFLPIHCAAMENRLAAVELLIKLNSPLPKNLFYIENTSSTSTEQYNYKLISHSNNYLRYESRSQTKEVSQELNHTTYDFKIIPFLIHLIKHNDYKLAETLVLKGIDLNRKDDYGKTALFYCKNEALKKLLISHGAE